MIGRLRCMQATERKPTVPWTAAECGVSLQLPYRPRDADRRQLPHIDRDLDGCISGSRTPALSPRGARRAEDANRHEAEEKHEPPVGRGAEPVDVAPRPGRRTSVSSRTSSAPTVRPMRIALSTPAVHVCRLMCDYVDEAYDRVGDLSARGSLLAARPPLGGRRLSLGAR